MSANVFFGLFLGFGTLAAVINRKAKFTKQPLLWPVANPKINSPFGDRINPVTKLAQFHNGVDLAGKVGTVIAAPADGFVSSQTYNDSGGLSMIITHDNGYKTGYAHLSKYAVQLNQVVKQSQLIAYMGATGKVTGPHLHFTVRDSTNIHVDPAKHCI